MKVLLNILLTLSIVLCEVPPPYPSRGFRPSQPFFIPSQNQPQRQYGPPVSPQAQYGVPSLENDPVKLSTRPTQFRGGWPQRQYQRPIEIDVRSNLRTVNDQLRSTYGAPSKQEFPKDEYGPPVKIDVRNNLRIVNSPLQAAYAVPSRQELPSNQYGPPFNNYQVSRPANNNFQDNIRPDQLQTSYGVPSKQEYPSDQYGPPPNNYQAPKPTNNFHCNLRPSHSQPQIAYGPPNEIEQPQSQYGVPDTRNIETFDRTRQGDTQQQKIHELNNRPTVQYLPVKEAISFTKSNVDQKSQQYLPVRQPTNFRNEELQPSKQYLPIKAATNFNSIPTSNQNSFAISSSVNSNNINSQYIPPEDSRSQNVGSKFETPQQQYIPSSQANPGKVTLLNNFDVTPYQVPDQNSGTDSENGQVNYQRPQNSQYQPANQNHGTGSNTRGTGNQNSELDRRQARFSTQPPDFDITRVELKTWSPDYNENNDQSVAGATISPNGNSGKEQSGLSGNTVTERYLPPSTTPRSVIRRPSRPTIVPVTTSRPIRDPEETTESNGESANPNIAVATAVAGGPGGQQFYLLQPDGRLQSVLYQKTREEGDREYEYTANYHFQNIQADPNVVYAPLISLG